MVGCQDQRIEEQSPFTLLINTQNPGNADPVVIYFSGPQKSVSVSRDCRFMITLKKGDRFFNHRD